MNVNDNNNNKTMDSGWTEVKKDKREKKEKKNKKENNYVLTYQEKLLLKNQNIFCNCCQASFISNIIGRKIVECGKCVCCLTD